MKPRIVQYRDCTQFSSDNFRKKLLENLSLENINPNSNGLEKFIQICIKTLNRVAPRIKYIRSNNVQFFNKELSNVYKKKRNFEIVILKKDLIKIKIKGFILNNEIFVFLYYEKLKRWQSKSQGNS